MTFGARIRELREAKGWIIRDLARAMDTSESYISNLERGVNEPGRAMIERLCLALGCTPNDLFSVDRPEQPLAANQ